MRSLEAGSRLHPFRSSLRIPTGREVSKVSNPEDRLLYEASRYFKPDLRTVVENLIRSVLKRDLVRLHLDISKLDREQFSIISVRCGRQKSSNMFPDTENSYLNRLHPSYSFLIPDISPRVGILAAAKAEREAEVRRL